MVRVSSGLIKVMGSNPVLGLVFTVASRGYPVYTPKKETKWVPIKKSNDTKSMTPIIKEGLQYTL